MIYTVTLNPTLDKTLSVPVLRPGEVHRARFLRQDIGGKGINVSRALAALGIASIPIGFLGGATGKAMRDGLAADGFDARFVEVPGETRQNLTLLDESTGVYTKINEPGPTVGAGQLAALHGLVAGLAAPGDLWAFCGSLPPGAPADLYAELIAAVQARGARAILDTSGEALAAGLPARPFGLKPNSEEAAEALGRPVTTDAQHVTAAVRLAVLGGDAGVPDARRPRPAAGVRRSVVRGRTAAGGRAQPGRRGGCHARGPAVGACRWLRCARNRAAGGGLRHSRGDAGRYGHGAAIPGRDPSGAGQDHAGRSPAIIIPGYCLMTRFCVSLRP